MNYHLEGGQILLPPDEPLVPRSKGSDQVIRIHYDVNEGVAQAEERAVSSWKIKIK